jgi:hypothetical protein
MIIRLSAGTITIGTLWVLIIAVAVVAFGYGF